MFRVVFFNSVLNEKGESEVGALSVIVKTDGLFAALLWTYCVAKHIVKMSAVKHSASDCVGNCERRAIPY